jgi:hypothetical protein
MNHLEWLVLFLSLLVGNDLVGYYLLRTATRPVRWVGFWALTAILFGAAYLLPDSDPFLRLAAYLVAAAKIQNTGDVSFKSLKAPFKTRSFIEYITWSSLPPDTIPAKTPEEKRSNRSEALRRIGVGSIQTLVGAGIVGANLKFRFGDLSVWLLWPYCAAIALTLPSGVFRLIVGTYMLVTGNRCLPMFNNPVLSTTISEFWGSRWNLMFVRCIKRGAFLPLVRAGWSPAVAALASFGVSAFVHELLILVVLGRLDGFNGLFFLLQTIPIVLERRFRHEYNRLPSPVRRLITWIWFAATGPLFFWAFMEMFPIIF